jgi:glycosyltransferase involved in cell wall biosynthesis
MAAADVAIGLRSIYWGETPSSTLRLLAAGLPVVVNDIGAFAELPDEVCCKIAPDKADTAGALFVILRDLYDEADRRTGMSRAARAYIARVHDPAAAARQYFQAAEAVVQL